VNTLARRFAVTLAATTVALATAPTRSESSPLDIELWPTLTCRGGAITRAAVDSTNTNLTIEGWLGCSQPPGQSKQFGYARYTAATEFGILGYSDLEFYDRVAPTLFTRTKGVSTDVTDLAICIVTTHSVRAACIRITREMAGGAVIAQPIANTDPLVAKEVQLAGPTDPGSVPNCGSCW
jgi:hypothetical protein